jgi:uncharacterized protein (DUF362 family)
MPPKTVYYVGTSPGNLLEDVARVVDMSIGPHLDVARPTLIKINGNYDRYYPGSNSSPWMMNALLKTLRDRGFTNLTVVEGDLPQFRARDMIVRTKLKPILDRYGVPFVDYEQQRRDRQEIPLIFRDSQLVNNPVPHGHGITKISCACKNLFGILPVTRRRYHRSLSDKLIELVTQLPMYTIVDGTVGLDGESTRRGNPRRMDFVLAGYDPYAIDAVVARILGFSPPEIPLLAEAHRRGLADYEVELRGDTTDLNTLPVHPFPHHLSLLRRSSMKLEATRLEQNRMFVWLLHKIVRANHWATFYRKRKMLYRGRWMQYAEFAGFDG